MKKNLVLSAIALFVVAGCAGMATIATSEQKTKQEVVEFQGMDKDIIYKKSLEWIASTFGSGKQVLEYQNKDDGKIIGNIVTDFSPIATVTLSSASSMTIEIKTGKVRITYLMKDVHSSDAQGPWSRNTIYVSEANDVVQSYDDITKSYKAFIAKQNTSW